jgi:hypothetical protein
MTRKSIDVYIMQGWFKAEWSPVEGHCSRSSAYQSFRDPHPMYGEPALNMRGRSY